MVGILATILSIEILRDEVLDEVEFIRGILVFVDTKEKEPKYWKTTIPDTYSPFRQWAITRNLKVGEVVANFHERHSSAMGDVTTFRV